MGKYSKKREKRDVVREQADRFINSLELVRDGTLPRPAWFAGWNRELGRPRNGLSGHVYRGINVLTHMLSGYSDPRWYSRKQILEHCGYVFEGKGPVWAGKGPVPEQFPLKGQKASPIVYYGSFTKEQENEKGEKEERRILFVKYNNCWNHEQVAWPTGREPKVKGELEIDPRTADDQALAIWEDHNPDTSWGGDKAFYSPSADSIRLPEPHSFKSVEHYWSTAIHELSHWTGHIKRLAREGIVNAPVSRQKYAIEELIAEMASAFMCAYLGLPMEKLMHEEYILNWMQAVNDEPKVLISAASKAQQIMDYLLREEAPSYGEED